MPNLVVSSDVDAMLQAANDAAIRSNIGAASSATVATLVTDVATNTTNIASNYSSITTNASDINDLGELITANTSNISTNASNISTNTSNISTNTSNISTNTSNIATKAPKASPTFTGTAEFNGNLTVDGTNKAITKENCYNKTGAVRLQRGSTDSEEVLLRYEGQNSEDFVIEQYHGGNKEGQIKFQGDTPNGSNTVRLDAKNVDVGYINTVLTKIFGDTNFGANKKFVFVDSRDTTDGIHFQHSGVGTTFQIGRFGSYGDSDIGQFKITYTDSSNNIEEVIVVDKDNAYTKIESDRTEMKNAKASGYVQVGTFNGSSNFPTGAQAGAIIFNSSNGTFNGFDGSSWTELG